MTTTTVNETTVTSRSRNLGVEITTSPVQQWNKDYTHSSLGFELPDSTPMRTSYRGVQREIDAFHALRLNCDYGAAIYVDGRRVKAVWGFIPADSDDMLEALDKGRWGWVHPSWPRIAEELEAGRDVKVKLA